MVDLANRKKVARKQEAKPEPPGPRHFETTSRFVWSSLIVQVCIVACFCIAISTTGYLILAIVAIVATFPVILVLGISPIFTKHTVDALGITLRQGWYYRARIPASNILDVSLADEDARSISVRYSLRQEKLFVTLSSVPLVHIGLREPQPFPGSSKNPVRTVVASVDDPEGFLDAARKIPGVVVVTEKRCAHCYRPFKMPENQTADVARHESPRIEYIFLIHEDGRLVFQYTGGRLRPVSSASVSGMLIVIQDFIRDAFKTEGGALRTLEHGDLTVVIENSDYLFLAVVVSGQDYPGTLRPSMKSALKELDSDFGTVLRKWDGKPPEGVGKLISQVLWV